MRPLARGARCSRCPQRVSLDPLQTAQFAATVYDQFNVLMTNAAIVWSAQGVSVGGTGLATADGDAGYYRETGNRVFLLLEQWYRGQ